MLRRQDFQVKCLEQLQLRVERVAVEVEVAAIRPGRLAAALRWRSCWKGLVV